MLIYWLNHSIGAQLPLQEGNEKYGQKEEFSINATFSPDFELTNPATTHGEVKVCYLDALITLYKSSLMQEHVVSTGIWAPGVVLAQWGSAESSGASHRRSQTTVTLTQSETLSHDHICVLLWLQSERAKRGLERAQKVTRGRGEGEKWRGRESAVYMSSACTIINLSHSWTAGGTSHGRH